MTDDDRERCHDCDDPYTALGTHWARSSECSYPVLSVADEQLLDGLMVVGGRLAHRDRDTNPYIAIVHSDRDVLEHLADELGVVASGVSEYHRSETADGDEQLWRLRTRSLPALDRYRGWYDGDGRAVPDDVEPSPRLLRTVCLLAARQPSDRSGLYLSLRRTRPDETVVERLFGDYRPRVVTTAEGGHVVRLLDGDGLATDLAPWPTVAPDCLQPT